MKKKMIVHSLETLERNFGIVITSEKESAVTQPSMPSIRLQSPSGLMSV